MYYLSVKIRLSRRGRKKSPFYKVVVADSRCPRDGKIIEEVGYYNPLRTPIELKLNEEKINAWLSNGAQPTQIVKDLLVKAKYKVLNSGKNSV